MEGFAVTCPEISRALKQDDVKEKLITQGLETRGTTPDELGRVVREESQKFAKLIKLANVKAN